MGTKKKVPQKTSKVQRKAKATSSADNYEYDDGTGDAEEGRESGKVRMQDDESIDDDASEVGWDEDDEAAFGRYLSKQSADADEEDEQSDQEEAEDGEMLLSDLISGGAPASVVNEDEEQESERDGAEYSEEEEEQTHEQLLRAMQKFSSSETADSKRKVKNKALKAFEQSFADSAHSSLTGARAVSMDLLLEPLQSSKGFGAMHKKLAVLQSGSKAPKLVDKVVSERIERCLLYEETSAEMGRWKESVSENRHVKTLDLTDDQYHQPGYKSLISDFAPTTEMEKQIQMILVKSRSSEGEVQAREEELLRARDLSAEEMAQRQGELSKVRALLFYEQMKRHRINKIKSKAYRRIRKKQKERHEGVAGEGSDDEEGEEPNSEEYARVKERMDLKHKNTGKWAKMALTYSKGDKSLRQAYHDSVQLGQDLVKKINEDELQAASAGADEDAWQEESSSSLVDRASRELDMINASEAPVVDGKFKKLFEMGFMQRAAMQQREAAREEAQDVLRELRAMDDDADSDDHVLDAAEVAKRTAAASAMSAMMAGKSKASMFAFSKGAVRVNGNISVEVPDAAVSEEAGSKGAAPENPWLVPGARQSSREPQTQILKSALYANIDTLLEVSEKSHSKAEKSSLGKRPKPNAKESVVVLSSAPTPAVAQDDSTSVKKKKLNERKPLLMQRSQEDLVQMAFAGPDYEEDFDELKRLTVDAEIEVDERKNSILASVKPGWGDWAGPGLTGITKKTELRRDLLLEASRKEDEKKRKERKDSKMFNVILSDRRIKAASKYKISEIPHPYTTREEYERSIQHPLGDEWNATHVVKKNTAPEVITRAGKIIAPIRAPKRKN